MPVRCVWGGSAKREGEREGAERGREREESQNAFEKRVLWRLLEEEDAGERERKKCIGKRVVVEACDGDD